MTDPLALPTRASAAIRGLSATRVVSTGSTALKWGAVPGSSWLAVAAPGALTEEVMMRYVSLLLLVLATLYCTPGHAQSLRCDGDLVQIGDSKAAVLQKCGAPFFAEALCLRGDQLFRIPPSRDGYPEYTPWCDLVDEWAYNPGFGQFITILRFHAGALILIRYGDRVR